MDIFRYTHELQLNPTQMHYLTEETLLLDIETTGFKASYQTCYEIGVCHKISDQELEILLFFAHNKLEEKEMLASFLNFIKDYTTLITFNGNQFDLPFLVERCHYHNLSFTTEAYQRIDLYEKAKEIKHLLKLPKLNQTTIERYLGIFREDEMTGGELVSVYKEYEKDSDPEKLELLKLHNHDDVIGMVKLLSMLTINILLESSFTVDSFTLDGNDSLILSGHITYPINHFSIDDKLRIKTDQIYLHAYQDTVKASLPLFDGCIRYYYPNPKDYVYVISEDMVIPKALSKTMDKNNIKKATKDNCYTTIDCANVTTSWLEEYLQRVLREA